MHSDRKADRRYSFTPNPAPTRLASYLARTCRSAKNGHYLTDLKRERHAKQVTERNPDFIPSQVRQSLAEIHELEP